MRFSQSHVCWPAIEGRQGVLPPLHECLCQVLIVWCRELPPLHEFLGRGLRLGKNQPTLLRPLVLILPPLHGCLAGDSHLRLPFFLPYTRLLPLFMSVSSAGHRLRKGISVCGFHGDQTVTGLQVLASLLHFLDGIFEKIVVSNPQSSTEHVCNDFATSGDGVRCCLRDCFAFSYLRVLT